MSGLAWLAMLCGVAARAEQPIAFPHNRHMRLGLSCLDCHSGADIRAVAGIPSVQECMLCHAKLLTNRAEVKKVIAYASKNIEIPWVRIYGFSPDAHVKFEHAPHYRAGISCARCHGDVATAITAERVVRHNMGTCLSCHRQNHASEDCAACHF